jgi:hypothetical protein
VLLSTPPPTDTTPPKVAAVSPANGTSNVATNAKPTLTLSEPINPATLNANTLFLRAANNVIVPASIAYNAATNTVTLTPAAAVANAAGYTLVVKGGSAGIKDVAGNALVSDANYSFTTVAAASSQLSLWTSSTTPAIIDSGDGKAVEVGMKFTSDVSGFISGLKFYKSAANTGVHTASLWTATGQLLATATFSNETAQGWQQVNFVTPVAITAGTTYVASYHTTTGHYAVSRAFLASGFASGPLHVQANGGVYLYGAHAFPTQTFQASNYWVDVLLNT